MYPVIVPQSGRRTVDKTRPHMPLCGSKPKVPASYTSTMSRWYPGHEEHRNEKSR
jgi:hypothetical protein